MAAVPAVTCRGGSGATVPAHRQCDRRCINVDSGELRSMKDSGLRQKVVIVTGAANGIGRPTALRFAQEGAHVATWDVNNLAADELGQELEANGAAGTLFRTVDVTDSASVQAGVDEVVSRWNRIDVLVNNAGILRDGLLVKMK